MSQFRCAQTTSDRNVGRRRLLLILLQHVRDTGVTRLSQHSFQTLPAWSLPWENATIWKFSKQKTKQTWLPNVQQKRLHSEALGENMKLKLMTRALRTIKKVRSNTCFFVQGFLTGFIFVQYGGLDNYLLSTDLLGQEGMRLRVLVRERRGLKALENAKEVTRAL
jgi:hypothetical protein